MEVQSGSHFQMRGGCKVKGGSLLRGQPGCSMAFKDVLEVSGNAGVELDGSTVNVTNLTANIANITCTGSTNISVAKMEVAASTITIDDALSRMIVTGESRAAESTVTSAIGPGSLVQGAGTLGFETGVPCAHDLSLFRPLALPHPATV